MARLSRQICSLKARAIIARKVAILCTISNLSGADHILAFKTNNLSNCKGQQLLYKVIINIDKIRFFDELFKNLFCFQICMNATRRATFCNNKVSLKDVILTNYHILLMTNTGLYVSSTMSLAVPVSAEKSFILSWTRGRLVLHLNSHVNH